MGLTVAVRNTELDNIFQGVFISLHTGDPGTDGSNEVTGGSYVRQAENFGAASSGALTNASNLTFEDMPACTVTYFGIWTAESGGTFRGGWILTEAQEILVTQSAVFPAGELDVSWPVG